eukprot:8669801-Heterocapsa_arctica.AAC.1
MSSAKAFTLVLGAIVHDMGHDGRNNQFHINAQDSMSYERSERALAVTIGLATTIRCRTV